MLFLNALQKLALDIVFALIYSDANVQTKLWRSYDHKTAAG